MSKHGLTRVTYRGDKVTIVAGAVPQHIADEATSIEAAPRPGATKTIPKPPIPPARVPKAAVVPPDAKPQAELPPAAKEKK